MGAFGIHISLDDHLTGGKRSCGKAITNEVQTKVDRQARIDAAKIYYGEHSMNPRRKKRLGIVLAIFLVSMQLLD